MTLGKSGEDTAIHYLRKKSYRILKRNFRSRVGEIDIIASHGRTLVFCEVKTRLNRTYGHPFEAVTERKQRTIRNVAELYLATSADMRDFDAVRFDVISIASSGSSLEITHLENAFR